MNEKIQYLSHVFIDVTGYCQPVVSYHFIFYESLRFGPPITIECMYPQ